MRLYVALLLSLVHKRRQRTLAERVSDGTHGTVACCAEVTP